MIQKVVHHNGNDILVFGLKKCGKTYGLSRYKNITIIWDEDYDTRVCDFVDGYLLWADIQFKNLIAVAEHEGELSLLFFGYVPDELKVSEVNVRDDQWTIKSAKTVGVKDVL